MLTVYVHPMSWAPQLDTQVNGRFRCRHMIGTNTVKGRRVISDLGLREEDIPEEVVAELSLDG